MQNDQDELHLHTIQPYLVLKTGDFRQHIMTSYGISHFFEFNFVETGEESVPFIPDGCSNFIFEYSRNGMKAEVFGSTENTKPFLLERDTDYFGVRFQPGENPCFTELPVKKLINNSITLSRFPKMRQLCENMAKQKTFNDRMNTFLCEYASYENRQNTIFRQIIHIIYDNNGILKIPDLESYSGYSARYINQIFETKAGISAKQFCKIIRLQAMLDKMNSGTINSLSEFAMDYQFYDQSHFIHDFENFTGITPSKYLKEVAEKNYRKCVTDI